jgi:hypothetical protein
VRRKSKKRGPKPPSARRLAAITDRCDPVCIECGALATDLVGGAAIYGDRPDRPDMMAKMFWRCACGAYVGCHPGTELALGYPAGPETIKARSAAHAAFDPLWRRKMARDGCSQKEARQAGYAWLASQPDMPQSECHMARFNAAQARKVVEICAAWAPGAARAAPLAAAPSSEETHV